MKKTLALILTLMMLLTAVSALAVESKGIDDLVSGETKMYEIDPETGEKKEVEATVGVKKVTLPLDIISAKDKFMAAIREAIAKATEEVEKKAAEAAEPIPPEELKKMLDEAVNAAILGVIPEKAYTSLQEATGAVEGLELTDLTTVSETVTLQNEGDGSGMTEHTIISVVVKFPTVYADDAKIVALLGVMNDAQTDYADWLGKPANVVDGGKVEFEISAEDVMEIGSSAYDVYVLE